jgi:hypothetical protein
VIEKRLTRSAGGDPVLVIKVTGASDVYRLAEHLKRGQVEFAMFGRRISASLYKQLGRAAFKALEMAWR